MSHCEAEILIVEDTLSVGLVYEEWLKKERLNARRVEDGTSALAHLRSGGYRVVLLDLQLPDIGGMEIMETIRAEQIPVTVVVVTSTGSIKTAVDVMRAGAYDYIVKPVAAERLVTTTRNALERETLQAVVKEFSSPVTKSGTNGFIGSSLPMKAVYKTIEAVGSSGASVFITGESGTGKELCAQAIHAASPRRSKPFIALNCAAIPKDLLESEIFGHLKGAFTGATSNRDGAALAANGGTLFLDEICELDLALQSKLLRFLQTGTVQKVGSDRLEKVDLRIVCATNRNPVAEVEAGRFREDLYYRLHVVPVHLPPLRERGHDCLEIARSLLVEISEEENKNFNQFSADAETALLAHFWPGNVRELQNVLRNAVILNEGETIKADMLPLNHLPKPGAVRVQLGSNAPTLSGPQINIALGRSYNQIERDIVEATIDLCDGSIPRAAEMLQVSPSTLYRKRESWTDTD